MSTKEWKQAIAVFMLGSVLSFFSGQSNVALAQTSQPQSSTQDFTDVQDKAQTEKDLRDDIKMRLNDLQYKIKRLADQFESIQSKIDRLTGRVERIQRLENLNSRIDSIERKLDSVENLAQRLEQSRS